MDHVWKETIQTIKKELRKHFLTVSLYDQRELRKLATQMESWGLPGGPVVKVQCFLCAGLASIPGLGTKTPLAPWREQIFLNVWMKCLHLGLRPWICSSVS